MLLSIIYNKTIMLLCIKIFNKEAVVLDKINF